MSVIREWRWNDREDGCDGVTLCTDSVTLWSANWRAPFTDYGFEWTIEEFKTTGTNSAGRLGSFTAGNSKDRKIGDEMKNTIGFVVLLAAILGCSSFSKKETANNAPPPPAKTEPAKTDAAPPSASDLTLEKFNQLTVGMKYDEVVKILGSAGTESSSSSSAGNTYKTYKWEGEKNARITGMFKNNELTSKNQTSLRSTSPSAATADLTMAKYDQLQTGMSLAEAVKIIGSEGSQTSNSTSGSYKSATYKWEGDKNARIYVIFKDDKIQSKSQSNLK